ncbi:MAG: DUF2249 domain-containing protein [Bacteroidetes bacterium]|nr:DUF2249 domain-containing protein [Bacteroidota bacterium]MBK7108600.1 DUF2249 domain-containing protein [Bacteroidota bacterium]MBK8489074.1 DUF2249 domain-containing protein [Bacteroidota bacterium]MBK8680923.1 DUF2249 domain-containing protein [Bacteroidota bacterium]MBP9703418.1 DUF2249 domain-containing protein [Chitinophagales bacterium]
MKPINSNTKIAVVLKENPDALEAIISLSPKFNKLRNPLLRKLMAARTSIGMASKVGGCSVNDFFNKLEPLGFTIDRELPMEEVSKQNNIPEFMQNISTDKVVELDVRADIESGKDPLTLIMNAVKQLKQGQILKLINSFEPFPLIQLLGKQGFESHVETINDNLVYTYFYKQDGNEIKVVDPSKATEGWDEMMQHYAGKLETVDVRQLEMPLPMLTILEALDTLPNDNALYVIHKRIPVFLLPELTERKFEYRIKEVGDGEVYLLIYKG